LSCFGSAPKLISTISSWRDRPSPSGGCPLLNEPGTCPPLPNAFEATELSHQSRLLCRNSNFPEPPSITENQTSILIKDVVKCFSSRRINTFRSDFAPSGSRQHADHELSPHRKTPVGTRYSGCASAYRRPGTFRRAIHHSNAFQFGQPIWMHDSSRSGCRTRSNIGADERIHSPIGAGSRGHDSQKPRWQEGSRPGVYSRRFKFLADGLLQAWRQIYEASVRSSRRLFPPLVIPVFRAPTARPRNLALPSQRYPTCVFLRRLQHRSNKSHPCNAIFHSRDQ
jgi:hypothetical protein